MREMWCAYRLEWARRARNRMRRRYFRGLVSAERYADAEYRYARLSGNLR